MSIKMMSAVWDAKTCLTPSEKLVLLKIADSANDSGECWPSQSNIARQCEVSRETVNRCLKQLEKYGFLKSQKKTKGYSVKVYKIKYDTLLPV